jgi:hypothetical protein
MNLPPDVLNKLVSLQVEIEGIDEAIEATELALGMMTADRSGGTERKALLERLAILKQAKSTKTASQKSTVSNAPKPTGGSGGGGGQKPITQQLTENLKNAQGMFDNLKNAVNADGFKAFVAGPFAPEFLEYLRGQGEEGVKILKGGINKIKAEYEKYQKIKRLKMNNMQLFEKRLKR